MRVYDAQLSIYFSDDGLPRGCFTISEPRQPRRSTTLRSEVLSRKDSVRSTPISKRVPEWRARRAN